MRHRNRSWSTEVDARVPRYTSYPTAPHFGSEIGPSEFARWIEAIPESSAVSLYIHVPFCRRLCWFCACRTQGTTSDEPVIAYVETLKSEIALLKAHLPRGVRLPRLVPAQGGRWRCPQLRGSGRAAARGRHQV